MARIVVHLDIHRANFQTLATMNTFFLVAADTEQGEVAHRLEEDRDGADVFTESAVVLEHHGQRNTNHIIDQVADEEEHEQGVFGGFAEMKQQKDKNQRQHKYDITDEAQLPSLSLWLFVRQQVENHGCPAAVAAPAPTE